MFFYVRILTVTKGIIYTIDQGRDLKCLICERYFPSADVTSSHSLCRGCVEKNDGKGFSCPSCDRVVKKHSHLHNKTSFSIIPDLARICGGMMNVLSWNPPQEAAEHRKVLEKASKRKVAGSRPSSAKKPRSACDPQNAPASSFTSLLSQFSNSYPYNRSIDSGSHEGPNHSTPSIESSNCLIMRAIEDGIESNGHAGWERNSMHEPTLRSSGCYEHIIPLIDPVCPSVDQVTAYASDTKIALQLTGLLPTDKQHRSSSGTAVQSGDAIAAPPVESRRFCSDAGPISLAHVEQANHCLYDRDTSPILPGIKAVTEPVPVLSHRKLRILQGEVAEIADFTCPALEKAKESELNESWKKTLSKIENARARSAAQLPKLKDDELVIYLDYCRGLRTLGISVDVHNIKSWDYLFKFKNTDFRSQVEYDLVQCRGISKIAKRFRAYNSKTEQMFSEFMKMPDPLEQKMLDAFQGIIALPDSGKRVKNLKRDFKEWFEGCKKSNKRNSRGYDDLLPICLSFFKKYDTGEEGLSIEKPGSWETLVGRDYGDAPVTDQLAKYAVILLTPLSISRALKRRET